MNRVYKIVWSKAKNAYVVTSELAKNHTRSASGKAVKAALTVAVGMGVLMGGYAADAAAKDIVDKGGNLIAYDISPANEGTNIAVGKNAKVFIGGGTQESMLSFGETIEHTLTGMHIHSNNAAKQNLPAGMAVGTNTYARTGSIQMGDHTLEKNQIAIGDTTADKLRQFGVASTTLGTNSYFLATNGGQVFTGGFALQSYDATLFAKDNDVIWHTYFLGLCAIAAVLVLGVLIAYLSVRKRNTLNSILDVITMFPFIIPGSVLGIAFVFAFNKSPIILTGTALIMIISFAVRRMPYTVRSSTAILGNISPSIEEAAISLGASDMTTFRKITVPMMMPGVLSGAIMSWVTIISELSSSIILYTNSTQTLTVSIYTEVIRGNYGNASAYATILTVTSILSLLLFYKVTGRRDVSV